MEIEDLVLSVEQMNHLKVLGVEVKDTAMAWFPPYKYDADGFPSYLFRDKDSYSVAFNDGDDAAIPTLTLQEILEMLPTDFLHYNEDDTEVIYGKNAQMIGFSFERIRSNNNLNILDCAYQTLCWCAANGYLNKE